MCFEEFLKSGKKRTLPPKILGKYLHISSVARMISGKDEKILPSISNQNYNDDLALSCTVVVEKGGGGGEGGSTVGEPNSC